LAVVLNLQREPRNLEYAVEDPILADDYKIAAATATDAANLKGSVWRQAPGAKSIPLETRERVLEGAKKFNFKPNFLARSLRTRQSFTIGVIVPEFSEGYFTTLGF
jgi:hypothetical protein